MTGYTECQTIRTVRYISRDDRARIATCSLRTLADRLKENYSVDDNISLSTLYSYEGHVIKLFTRFGCLSVCSLVISIFFMSESHA